MSNGAIGRVMAAAEASGTLSAGAGTPRIEPRVLVMVSGGADSVCLLHVTADLLGTARVHALHVNHGLRAAAPEEERFCADLCARMGVELHVERVEIPPRGNTEALAREARYEAAERVRASAGLDLIATGHTATDQVETILYRLASSPGRRALLGMEPIRGRVARPLLTVPRADTRAYCAEAGLPWTEDESNADRRLARNLLRLEVLPLLREINAGADRNVLATAAQLRDEAQVLEQAVEEAVLRTGAGGAPPAVDAGRLAAEPSPVRRLVLRRLAEAAAGSTVPLGPDEARAIERLAERGGSGTVDLGGGLHATVEYGIVRFGRGPGRGRGDGPPSAPAALAIPGRCRFGEWEVVSERDPPAPAGDLGSVDAPVLDAERVAHSLTVRAWRDGDRMKPLGLDGTKSLQDLFGDRKVPRSLRRSLPVVESDGEIAWVAGVAVSDRFRVGPDTRATVRLTAIRRQ
jgi:tRNA(Ile)-lysidine synthase